MLFGRPPPVRGRALLGRRSMQAAGFIVNYAQRCLLCLHQHARSRGRPPAPPHRRRTLCKNVQNFVSLRVIGTHGPRPWCCRETGVRRGDGGWCRAVKMEMRYAMVRRSHHGPWTSAVKRSIGEVVQLRRRPLLLVESRYYRLLSTFTYRGINARLA